ncbi:hypothetical protein Tco_0089208 [Tanacetum coccineum]
MPKSNKEKKFASNIKRTAKISIRPCCFTNPRPASPPYQTLSPPTDYQTVPPSTPNVSPPLSPITTLGISPSKLLLTPKSSPPPLTSSPPAPIQPSKYSSPLSINLDPVELIFSTLPTSLHTFFDSLEDLPPVTTNPHPPRSSFESIECLANQPSPLPAMEPLLPPLPPQLPPLPPQLPPIGPNNPFPMLTREMFCDHCQRTQVIVDNLRDEMRLILNHILDRKEDGDDVVGSSMEVKVRCSGSSGSIRRIQLMDTVYLRFRLDTAYPFSWIWRIQEAYKEDGDDVLGSSMEVKVQCKGNKVLNKGLEVGSKD